VDDVLSVSDVTREIRGALVSSPRLSGCAVRGEVSNLSRPKSGHLYFTLKDAQARLRVVLFAGRARGVRVALQDGMSVVVRGSIDVFERSGDYQLYADTVEPDGIGALYAAFVKVKEQLLAEGLFEAARKRPLPAFPARIAVITSPTGAVVRDVIVTLRRRFPLAHVLVVPVAVQGPDAPEQIRAAIELVSERRLADVAIVGRGGGSLEELSAFNDEGVARAAAACMVPLVSAVGHETDTTILDFVADVRAATPTAAAELVAPDVRTVAAGIEQIAANMAAVLRKRVENLRVRVDRLAQQPVLRDPGRRIERLGQRLDLLESALRDGLRLRSRSAESSVGSLHMRIATASPIHALRRQSVRVDHLELAARQGMARTLQRDEQLLTRAQERLALLSPLAILRRGYAVVLDSHSGQPLTSVERVQPGDSVHVRMSGGYLDCQVWGVHDDRE
jgi:exodeoxyribonuclease VII large subunit